MATESSGAVEPPSSLSLQLFPEDGVPQGELPPLHEQRLPRGMVTFLYTDIEGSTRLWQEQPSGMPEQGRLDLARSAMCEESWATEYGRGRGLALKDVVHLAVQYTGEPVGVDRPTDSRPIMPCLPLRSWWRFYLLCPGGRFFFL